MHPLPCEADACSVQVFVKTLTGKTITLNIDGDYDLVENIVSKVQKKTNTIENEIVLTYDGKQLEDGRDTWRYVIQKDSTLHQTALMLAGGNL